MIPGMQGPHLMLYLPARTCMVLAPVDLDPSKKPEPEAPKADDAAPAEAKKVRAKGTPKAKKA